MDIGQTMASSRNLFKAAPGGQFMDAVRRELFEGEGVPSVDDSSAIVRRALDIVDAVAHLLEAISPAEVEASADRAHIGRFPEFAGFWKVYSVRHRVLSEVFSTHRATFAEQARAFMAKRRQAASGSPSQADREEGEPR
jgi:hypothetical protein